MAGSEETTLIWTRREPGDRRPKFTRTQIASTALAIADAEGFAAVTMRRVARELGAGTMTLYYYVHTRNELIALMDDAIMSDALIPQEHFPAHWYDAATAIAVRTREVLLRHPWALHALQGVPAGPNAMRHFEQSLAALADTALDPQNKYTVITAIDDYVHGNVLHSVEATTTDLAEDTAAALRNFIETQLDTGEFPHTEVLFDSTTSEARIPTESTEAEPFHGSETQRFHEGLAAVLHGLAKRMGLELPTRERMPRNTPHATPVGNQPTSNEANSG